MCVLSAVPLHLNLCHINSITIVEFNFKNWKNQATKTVDLKIEESKSINRLNGESKIAIKPHKK